MEFDNALVQRIGADLSLEQKYALHLVSKGEHVLITGAGGVGKSTMIPKLKQLLAAKMRTYNLTASTGIAALNIGGTTLHHFAGAGLAKGTKEAVLKDVMRNRKKLWSWRRCQVLIVDEISMIAPLFFDKLEYVARKVRGRETFFGGIQLVLLGDFFQLPPVLDNTEANAQKFCFQSKLFKENVTNVIELTKVFRQTDYEFVKVLADIRRGNLTDAGFKMLSERVNAEIDTSDGIEPTRLYPLRAQVDNINRMRLVELEGEPHVYTATQFTLGIKQTKRREEILQRLATKCPAEKELTLKKGAQVMLLVNLKTEEGLVNGSRGVVDGFADCKEQWPIVKFANGLYETLEPYSWIEKPQDENWSATYSQVPLKLAYALSIHKSKHPLLLIVSRPGYHPRSSRGQSWRRL